MKPETRRKLSAAGRKGYEAQAAAADAERAELEEGYASLLSQTIELAATAHAYLDKRVTGEQLRHVLKELRIPPSALKLRRGVRWVREVANRRGFSTSTTRDGLALTPTEAFPPDPKEP